jgi:hypothetical protein
MPVTSVRRLIELDRGYVLAPERYHPLRTNKQGNETGVTLAELVIEVREVVSPSSRTVPHATKVLLFDTSDARAGFLEHKIEPVELHSIGSAKKVFQHGDILISRLRSYLKQVAYVDEGFSRLGETKLACSTEFLILRPRAKRSIAFLVPFLLSEQAQQVLAAAQEGGHHPRFRSEALMSLTVPNKLLKEQANISKLVEGLAKEYGEAQAGIHSLTSRVASSR